MVRSVTMDKTRSEPRSSVCRLRTTWDGLNHAYKAYLNGYRVFWNDYDTDGNDKKGWWVEGDTLTFKAKE